MLGLMALAVVQPSGAKAPECLWVSQPDAGTRQSEKEHGGQASGVVILLHMDANGPAEIGGDQDQSHGTRSWPQEEQSAPDFEESQSSKLAAAESRLGHLFNDWGRAGELRQSTHKQCCPDEQDKYLPNSPSKRA
jgi:hypothetical protein